MKKIALAVSALLMGSMSASAADLAARPYTKAPALVSVYDWSGFYIGVNGGWGSSPKCWDFTTPAGGFLFSGRLPDLTRGAPWGASWVFPEGRKQGFWPPERGEKGPFL